MNTRIALTTALIAALALPATAQTTPAKPREALPPDTVLIEEGNVRVKAADFEGNILRLPEDRRAPFRVSYDRVVAVLDNVFVTRSISQKARDLGLDKDPAVQARLRQLEDGFLADLYVQKLERDASGSSQELDTRARELYAADKEKYRTDEEAHVQQILISQVCRTRDAAMELARTAAAEARSGKNFLELAAKYSDVGDKANKGGDIGTGPVKKLVEPVREALAKLKPGEISDPVESQFGLHVLKLVERKPGALKPFEAVRGEIIAAERETLRRKRIEEVVNAVRNSKTVVTHRGEIEKLVAPGSVDLNELTEKAKAANKPRS
jgi:peptidyl-prolyl cis-trans isomerase C